MNQVLTSREKPPIFDRLQQQFGVSWDNVIIAYDGKVHSSKDIQPQKLIHEMVHLKRQKEIGNDAWWSLYFDSEEFRRDEEILAYVAEANFLKKHIKNREHRFKMINEIAASLSGETYGKIMTKNEALRLLM